MRKSLLAGLISFFFLFISLQAATTNTITQYGITWTFDQAYEYGQFVNGDYYVVGPVKVISITPKTTTVNGRTLHGSMLNPSPLLEEMVNVPDVYSYNQGYDSGCEYMTYNSSRNVALNVTSSTPLDLANGSSLISTISRTAEEIAADASNKTRIKSAAVLTVLTSIPAEGSFRPPYTGTDKIIKYNTSTVFGLEGTINLLGKLSPVANTPSLAEVERLFERPWIDHAAESWINRTFHPLENMPEYHREMAMQVGIGALMLHLNFTDAEKRTLLIRYLQMGIDFYEIYKLGRPRYPGESAAGAARKWPIIFGGIMLKDAAMQSVGVKSGRYLFTYNYPTYGPGNAPPDYEWFGEDTQILHVTQEDVDRTHSGLWAPDYRNENPESYETADIGMPEWGVHHAVSPYQSDRSWVAIYRQCCSAQAWIGYLLAARIMEENSGTQTLWNNQDLFDYLDRYMTVTAVDGSNPGYRAYDPFTESIWDTYRANYGPIHCPINCSAVAGNGRVDLSWGNDPRNTFVTGYNIYRSSNGGGIYAKVGSVAGTTFSDTGLTGGSSYYYQIRACDNHGESYPGIAYAVVANSGLPSTPSALIKTAVSATRVYLSWTDNGLNEEEFRIERSLNGTDYEEIGQTGSNITQYVDSGLTENASYYYRVRAYNAVGSSEYSNILEVQPSNTKPSITPVAGITCFEGEKIEFDLAVTDVNPPDTITLTPSQALPEGSTLTPGNNRTWRFFWQTDFTQAGAYTLAFTANDGSADSDPLNVNITVNEVSTGLQVTDHDDWN